MSTEVVDEGRARRWADLGTHGRIDVRRIAASRPVSSPMGRCGLRDCGSRCSTFSSGPCTPLEPCGPLERMARRAEPACVRGLAGPARQPHRRTTAPSGALRGTNAPLPSRSPCRAIGLEPSAIVAPRPESRFGPEAAPCPSSRGSLPPPGRSIPAPAASIPTSDARAPRSRHLDPRLRASIPLDRSRRSPGDLDRSSGGIDLRSDNS